MARLTANDRAKRVLADEGFSVKMIHVAELLANASDHRSLARWVRWFKRQSPDVMMDVELNVIMLTFHKYGRKPKME